MYIKLTTTSTSNQGGKLVEIERPVYINTAHIRVIGNIVGTSNKKTWIDVGVSDTIDVIETPEQVLEAIPQVS